MSLEETYARLEWRLKETNSIIDDKYWHLIEEMKKKHKTKLKIYDDYYNIIAAMNDRSTHIMLESNVRGRQTCERNLEGSFEKLERNLVGSFEKLYNFNEVSCQEVSLKH